MGLKEILLGIVDRVRFTEESQYLQMRADIETEFPTNPPAVEPGVRNADGSDFVNLLNTPPKND